MNQLLQESLIESGHVSQALLIRKKDGKIKAKAPTCFNVSDRDLQTLRDVFEKPHDFRSFEAVMPLCGTTYIPLRADNQSIYAKNENGGVIVVATKAHYLLGFYHATMEPAIAIEALEKLGGRQSQMGFTRTSSRMGTATAGGAEGGARPMTAVRAAGYSSRGRPGANTGDVFDPFNQAARMGMVGVSVDKTPEQTIEEQIKALEKKVHSLLEESCNHLEGGNASIALEKAKEAGKKERQLTKQREQAGLQDQINLDLTYCVLFNLANQYHANKMYQEALNSYAIIVKNKMFNQSGRLRVNMGNIYFEQKKYSQAIKMYRMALDQIPNTNKEIRLKIIRNIGNAFVRMGHFQDAITSYEAIMEGSPDYQSGFNLILCYFALGNSEKMKRGFHSLALVKQIQIEPSEDLGLNSTANEPIDDNDVFNEDELRSMSRERKAAAERYLILSGKLIAPVIESHYEAGFDWVVDCIKVSQHVEIASELEISKAIQYLKTKEFNKAIEALKAFEKKDPKMMGAAVTNLSFLYFLESDYRQAEKYAELAMSNDRYNAKALTNRGNCYFVKGTVDKAKECYQEAINLDATCAEAMYNIALVYKKSEAFGEALMWFEKIHSILRNSAEVIYQIADIYDNLGNVPQAMEWFNILISAVPTDPGILARLGDMFVKINDKPQAFQYYSESFRYFPSNMSVIAWLGAYYVECEVYEQAIQFFERAAMIQPNEVKWQLMVASCYRRSGNYQQSLDTYKRIHDRFPDNIECLRFLVRICTDLGMKDVQEYVAKLGQAEKLKQAKESNATSGITSSNAAGDREGSASQLNRFGGSNTSLSGSGKSNKLNMADTGAEESHRRGSGDFNAGSSATLAGKLLGGKESDKIKQGNAEVEFDDDVENLLPD